jgi:hypothetical protein
VEQGELQCREGVSHGWLAPACRFRSFSKPQLTSKSDYMGRLWQVSVRAQSSEAGLLFSFIAQISGAAIINTETLRILFSLLTAHEE